MCGHEMSISFFVAPCHHLLPLCAATCLLLRQGGTPAGVVLNGALEEGNRAAERFNRQEVVTTEITAALDAKDTDRLRALLEVRPACVGGSAVTPCGRERRDTVWEGVGVQSSGRE
jgi:hypothetical protein